MYLSLYCKGSKRLFKVLLREGVGDRTETVIFWPPSYGRQHCVFLILLMLNRRPWGPLCRVLAFFTASYQHLLWTPTHQGPDGPFGLMWLYLPHLVYNSSPTLTGTVWLLSWLSYIIVQRPLSSLLDFLESHVGSSSSGNNCHTVHRSLSSGASVYECTMGIFLPRPISSANFRPGISSHNCH